MAQEAPSTGTGYALIDSGDFQKLERFGAHILARPSQLCLWRRRESDVNWRKAKAVYSTEGTWSNALDEWRVDVHGVTLLLRCQTNGQIGLFPEHSLYLPRLRAHLLRAVSRKVLNLFAYTGMATTFCAKDDAHVTHVDLSKKTFEWARANLQANNIVGDAVRFIEDDAFKFLEREVKRQNTYDLIIADPPSFGRVSKTKSWSIEERLAELAYHAKLCLNATGMLVLTCHDQGIKHEVLANVARDYFPETEWQVTGEELLLREVSSERCLPAGCLVTCSAKT